MTVVNAVPRLLGVFLVIAAIVLLAGLGLSQTDLLNPTSSAAKQRQMDEQTRHMQAMNALEEQKTAQEIQIELERQKLRAQNEAHQQANRSRFLTIALIAALAVLVPGLWATIIWAAFYRARPAPRTVAAGRSLWHDQAYRRAMIQLARDRERLNGRQRIQAQLERNARANKGNHKDTLEWSDMDVGKHVPEMDGKEN